MNLSALYPKDDPVRVPLSRDIQRAVQEQLKDNKGAQYTRIQAIALQVGNLPVQDDILALLCEILVPTSTIIDNFAIDSQELMKIRSAEPISIVSCLNCRVHLPDDDRRTLLRQLRILGYLGRFEVEDDVEMKLIHELLCDVCSREYCLRCEEQLRAERLVRQARKAQLSRMPFAEYLKTSEWKALRNRALIRAGKRCQPCGRSDGTLDVHHNSYERFGDELLEDLVVLCRNCHQFFHGILPEAA